VIGRCGRGFSVPRCSPDCVGLSPITQIYNVNMPPIPTMEAYLRKRRLWCMALFIGWDGVCTWGGALPEVCGQQIVEEPRPLLLFCRT
jgi:hypothetical protein